MYTGLPTVSNTQSILQAIPTGRTSCIYQPLVTVYFESILAPHNYTGGITVASQRSSAEDDVNQGDEN